MNQKPHCLNLLDVVYSLCTAATRSAALCLLILLKLSLIDYGYSSSSSSSLSLSSSLLHLNLCREEKGMYQCIKTNSLESAQGYTTQLDLKEKPAQLTFKFKEGVIDPGTFASLKCVATGNPLPQITWTRDKEPFKEAYHIRVGDYVSDAFTVNSYVNISSATTEDGGLYGCTAVNSGGQVLHQARLNVVGPPSVRSIPNKTASSKQSIELYCPYTGYPISSIRWSRDGRRLPQNHKQKVYNNGTMIINDVESSLDAGRYECQVEDENKRTAKANLYLNIVVSPVVEPFSFPNDLVAGRRAGVACIVSAGDPPMTITWLKDQQPLLESLGATVNTNEFTSFLSFPQVIRAHNGNYTCEARNMAGKASYTSAMIVHEFPIWTYEPKDKSVVEGHSVRFDCQADGFPPPITRWRKSHDGQDFKVIISNANTQILENGSLSIREASKQDAGHYMCQAVNGVPPSASTVVRLIVNVAAHFKKKFESRTAKKGDQLVLHCNAFGDKPLQVKWTKDQKFIDSNSEPRYGFDEEEGEEFKKSILRISSVDKRDSAIFMCLASNFYGEDSTSFQVLVQEPPDCPKEVKASEVAGRSLTLSWNEPYDGNSPINGYIIEYERKVNHVNKVLPDDREKKKVIQHILSNIKLTDLEPETSYFVTVFARNKIGQSPGCYPMVYRTDSEPPSLPPLNVQITPLSSTSLEVSWRVNKGLPSNNISGFYVGYRPKGSRDDFHFKTVDIKSHQKGATRNPMNDISTVITGLKKQTKYVMIVQAYNMKGAGPASEEVEAQTLESDPPLAPSLQIFSSTSRSILLSWGVNYSSHGHSTETNPPTGYILFHKSENTNWNEVPIYSDKLSFNLTNLRCGNKYQFYMTAFNNAGRSEPSEILTGHTQGNVPLAPEMQAFLSINSTSVLLNLNAWKDGGCPILNFNVQYKPKSQDEFILLSSNVLPEQEYVIINELLPATWYVLFVTASNEAGLTEVEYLFATLTKNGEQIFYHSNGSTGTEFISNFKLVPPVVAALTVVLLVLATVIAIYKKLDTHSFAGTSEPYEGKIYQDCRKSSNAFGTCIPLHEYSTPKGVSFCPNGDGLQPTLNISESGNFTRLNHFPAPPRTLLTVSDTDPSSQVKQSSHSNDYDVPFKKAASVNSLSLDKSDALVFGNLVYSLNDRQS